MDLDQIKRQAQAARQFELAVGPVVFCLEAPTKLESSVCYMEATGGKGASAAGMLRFQHALAQLCITGWRGVVVGHMLPGLDAQEASAPFAFEPGAAEVLLEAQPEWASAVVNALMDKVAQRVAVEDTAAKN